MFRLLGEGPKPSRASCDGALLIYLCCWVMLTIQVIPN